VIEYILSKLFVFLLDLLLLYFNFYQVLKIYFLLLSFRFLTSFF